MAKTLIFGHKNPDTDTICSAIAYADLKNKLGVDAEPVRLGDINGETQFALEKFNAELPRFVDEVSKETNEVILVDHNERQQSANDIDQVRVLEVLIITVLLTLKQQILYTIVQSQLDVRQRS